ncbi:delta-12-fatty acid desaturase [Sporodiniella umbellata]|nr:delta-12-fatty acid desaturase [Sporodiniella umbellata]
MTIQVNIKADVLQNLPAIDEAIARGWEIPDFTIKEIRDAIPSHCFQRDTLRSFTYVLHDFALVCSLGYAATYIDQINSLILRGILWCIYWTAQGIFGTGIWIIGHECGHQAFSQSKMINNSVGFVLHTFVLVPFYSWKFSHSKHHKSNGHMSKDQVHIPITRSKIGLPPQDQDKEADGPHSILEESPIAALYGITRLLLFGWPYYLFTHYSGREYSGWVSHFNPSCGIFEENQYWEVISSTAGITVMIGLLGYAGKVFGSINIINIPHYHAEEATIHIKKALGKHYKRDNTPIYLALWNTWRQCKFVEDYGDVVFYKN